MDGRSWLRVAMDMIREARFPVMLALICVFTFVVHADVLPVSLMEARNLIAAREMLQDGHWLLPTMNGSLRLAKPPLPTWLSAAAGLLAGDPSSLAALRLPAAMASLLMVLAVYGLGRRILDSRRGAFLAAAVLATSYLSMATGRQATWDAYCHSFMLLALWALVTGLDKPGQGRAVFVLAGSCMGLSLMSKGPVSFYALLLPFVLARGLASGLGFQRPRWSQALLTVAALLAVAAPWPLLMLASASGQSVAVIQAEVGAWGARHVQSVLYYANFPFMTGVWSLLTLGALVTACAGMRTGQDGRRRFCLLWLALTLALLGLVPEKKERYLLPALIPLAMLVGDYLDSLLRAARNGRLRRIDKMLLRLHAGILAAISLAVLVAAALLPYFGHGAARPVTLAAVAAVYATLSAVLVSSLRLLNVQRILAASVALVAVFWLLPLPLASSAGLMGHRYRPLAAIRNAREVHDLELYALGNIDERMVWHAGRRIAPWQAAPGRPLALPVAVLSETPLGDVPEALSGRASSIRPVAAYCVDEPSCGRKLHLYIIE